MQVIVVFLSAAALASASCLALSSAAAIDSASCLALISAAALASACCFALSSAASFAAFSFSIISRRSGGQIVDIGNPVNSPQ